MSEENLVGDETPNISDVGESVPVKKYQQLLSQRKSDQEKLRDIQTKLSAFEEKEREFQERQLEEQGKWQESIELKNRKIQEYEQKLKDEQNKAKNAENILINSAKLNAVLEKLPAKVKNRAYLDFIDTNSVILDPETGDFDAGSVQEVANAFIKEHSSLLDYKNVSGKLPGDAPAGSTKLTLEQWKKLPLAERKKRMSEVQY